MKIAYVTFGCRLNKAQAARERAALAAAGHEIVSPQDAPDRIIVRGCSVTAKAARESRRALSALRKANPGAEVLAAGCMESAGAPRETPAPLPRGTGFAPATARAWLEVQDGCSGKCAYCIVPHFRGPPRSVPWRLLEKEARAFLAAGCTEIVATGCNIALYRDPAEGIGAGGLLERLAALESPGHRVRLGSLEPAVCDDAVIEAIAGHSNICRFLHLSIQSASAPVLKRMNRAYGPDELDALAEKIRAAVPGIALGADLIAGFPGETERDFGETAAFVERHGFTHLHVFPYSERPGTAAAAMDGVVPPEERKSRAARLQEAGNDAKRRFAASFAGKTVEVCIERACAAGGVAAGWTSEYLECGVESPVPLERRRLIRALAVSADGDALKASARLQANAHFAS